MVREAVPELVTVKDWDFVCPSTMLPKLKLAGEMVNPAWVPVPFSGIVTVAFVASLVMVIKPVALPAVVGAYDPVSVTLCAGFSVAGTVRPLAVNPVPVRVNPVR